MKLYDYTSGHSVKWYREISSALLIMQCTAYFKDLERQQYARQQGVEVVGDGGGNDLKSNLDKVLTNINLLGFFAAIFFL